MYRVSLDPVQNLCLLDENPAVSQQERGIRNWTILRCVFIDKCRKIVARWNPSEGGDRGGLETRIASVIFGS